MTRTERLCLARVRLLALGAMRGAGGQPTRWQLDRALAPVGRELAAEATARRRPVTAAVELLLRTPPWSG